MSSIYGFFNSLFVDEIKKHVLEDIGVEDSDLDEFELVDRDRVLVEEFEEDCEIVSRQRPSHLGSEGKALLKSKTQELFQSTILEEIEYSQSDLSSCGQPNRANKLKPFTNFSEESPHTYSSNLVQGERGATYHINLAQAVIQHFSNCVPGKNTFESLQTQLKLNEFTKSNNKTYQDKNRALQVAAVLKQIGDDLSPLPQDTNINNPLTELKGRLSFDSQQQGRIEFENCLSDDGTIHRSKKGPIQIKIFETVDLEDEEGGVIASFGGSRVISVLEPDADGMVKCQVSRTYEVNNLNININ